MRELRWLFTVLAVMALSACTLLPYESISRNVGIPSLNQNVLAELRSGPNLKAVNGRVLTDNDDAFETKIQLIRQATRTIDLGYYIFSDDYSSSLMARELINAAVRGVRVRMLLDYHSHYQALNYFRMLETFGNKGTGSLFVRFYNRPTRNIIKDAVYMTLGCEQDSANGKKGCAEEKFKDIEQLFAADSIDAKLKAGKNISNVNSGKSGLFLSGLYGKNPELMAMAVSSGQDIDMAAIKSGAGESNPEDTENLKKLARLYWLANYGSGVDRLVNRIKLSAAFLFYGEKVDPVYDTFSAFLPVERSIQQPLSPDNVQQARNDWQYLTDFLHHKILLVDQQDLVIGGRNVQDAYHMNPNPLSAKYTFMDTDVHLRFYEPQIAVTDSFEKLWNFDTMVATLQDIEQHAPNDFLVNSSEAKQACESLANGPNAAHQNCLDNALLEQTQRSLSDRYQQLYSMMNERADRYLTDYLPIHDSLRSPVFPLDTTAVAGYVENLPFDKSKPQRQSQRLYGANNDQERASGKNIHALWLSAMKKSCESATPDTPVTVYMHNAYFFLPSNLLSAVAQMIDGRQPCANVDIVVLSNSMETTDLNVVNVLSRHSMKALFEHYADHHDPANGATLEYFEYVPQDNAENRSLHSKVMIFGDDMFIGSANADLRSYMMDSNNGLFIQQAPQLLDDYTAWLRKILSDESLTANQNAYYLNTDRSQILEAGDRLIDTELAKYRAERFLKDPQQILELKTRLRDASNEVYQLSRKIIADHHGSTDEQAMFNSLFKAI